MWVGPVGARPDHGEVDLLVSELSQQRGKISRNFGLPPTSKTPLTISPQAESVADPAAASRMKFASSLTARIIGRLSVIAR